eukprot:138472_1
MLFILISLAVFIEVGFGLKCSEVKCKGTCKEDCRWNPGVNGHCKKECECYWRCDAGYVPSGGGWIPPSCEFQCRKNSNDGWNDFSDLENNAPLVAYGDLNPDSAKSYFAQPIPAPEISVKKDGEHYHGLDEYKFIDLQSLSLNVIMSVVTQSLVIALVAACYCLYRRHATNNQPHHVFSKVANDEEDELTEEEPINAFAQ